MLDDLLERFLSGDGGPAADHVGLGMLLAEAHNRSRERLNLALRPLGVDVRGLAVLLALPMYGPVSQRDLIGHLGIDKSTMVRVIDELEKAGLVSRERDPQDRRAHAIVLTPHGEQTLSEARRVTDRVGGDLFGGLTESDRHRLTALLRAIAARAARTPPGPP
ncbi:MarR family winged helix-turn-helix transcriptional regulator [Bailinhaonella thermotolerans]|uniref:MarR family transcriptional regulator n=1 Tax=Bailinhaonella thermotolerans TaxID=1070861 RepID=A0A3A4ASF2_9ACTN|nr:MarR family transcriptional regulator [Bailinhaonella thermotolerans]RJL32828.1 MarR family transcriptional regulator [Bailinhaonella thermotolerans]